MITQHPAYPKKEIEKYYLQSQLPDYQKIPGNEHQIKNNDYYNDNTHIWNNPHQAKSNPKVFKQIQQQNDKGEKRIKKLQELEQKEKQQLQKNKIIYYNLAREEDLQRLQSRKLERGSLQNMSQQQNDVQVDQIHLKPILSRTALLGRPDFLWNKLNQQSQKYVNLLINPKILAMEEQGVKAISEKIQKDQQIESIKEELRLKNMELIKEQSTKRRINNLELEQKSGIMPSRVSLQRVTSSQSRFGQQSKDVIESTLQAIEKQQQQSQTLQYLNNQIMYPQNLSNRPFTVGSDQYSMSLNNGIRPQTHQTQQRISNQQTSLLIINNSTKKSKSTSILQNKHPLDRTEFKGLLLAQATEQAESNFSKTLQANSSLLKEQSIHYSRASIRHQMPPKQRKIIKCNYQDDVEQNNESNQLKQVNNMLDSFEKKLHKSTFFEDSQF